MYLPPTDGFGDRNLGQLLRLFQQVDLTATDSPIKINWQYIQDELGMSRSEVRAVLTKARCMGLLERLTIDYDHQRWLAHSREKGCLLVYTYVEESDLRRDPTECASAFCDVVDEIVNAVLSRDKRKRQTLRHVFVVPNGHLAPREEPVESTKALEVLETLVVGLRERGYKAKLNSFGYAKLIQTSINAHKIGYVGRVV